MWPSAGAPEVAGAPVVEGAPVVGAGVVGAPVVGVEDPLSEHAASAATARLTATRVGSGRRSLGTARP